LRRSAQNRVKCEDYGATSDHLKVFISRLRAKLESGDVHYIETERGPGYRFVKPR
jgi:DNA-binding response OmpR family regulator